MKMHNKSKIWFVNNKLNLLRRSKKYFFMIFHVTAPLTVLAIKRGLFWDFGKTFKGSHFKGNSGTDLEFLVIIDL